MSNIIRRSDLAPTSAAVRIDRATGRALDAVRADALVREAQEYVAARQVQVRLDNATHLGQRAVLQLKGLHVLITELTRDNPALEAELRPIGSIVTLGAQQVIANYLMRPL